MATKLQKMILGKLADETIFSWTIERQKISIFLLVFIPIDRQSIFVLQRKSNHKLLYSLSDSLNKNHLFIQ